MVNTGLMMEYEEILLGTRKDFSPAYIGKETSRKDIIAILKYAFEEILGWSPFEVRDYLTMDVLEKLHLTKPVSKLEVPPEIDIEQDLFYIAWIVYPDVIHYSKRQLVLNVYQKVLDKRLQKFPKNFFLGADGSANACICLQYAINQKQPTETIPELYEMFGDKKRAIKFLRSEKLYAPFNDAYDYPVDMLHDALPENQKDELCYQYARFMSELKDVKDRQPVSKKTKRNQNK